MLELLPDVQKKSLKKEYFLRLTVVSLLFSLAAGILFLVFLSPSYFLSVEKWKIVNQEFENIKKSNVDAGDEELWSSIKNSKEMLTLLAPVDNEFSKDLIVKIISKKGSGVTINAISANYSKDNQYQIFVGGTSKNRELLKSFAENLREVKEFSDIDLPISNFAKISDIDFNITLKTAI